MQKGISFIIPVLNEEENLHQLLPILTSIKNSEVIVADGGSSDKSVVVAERYKCKVISTKPGRGMQMNAGAKITSKEILFFIHADVMITNEAVEAAVDLFEDGQVQAANYRMKFDTGNFLYKLYSFFTRYDFAFSKYGDQTLIIRKEFFKSLNGFADYKLFEDVDLLDRIRKKTKIHILPFSVIASTRRFKSKGIVWNQIYSTYLYTLFRLGTNTDKLYKKYYKKNALIVFVKLPFEGNVKTRLAKTIGDKKAVLFYNLIVTNLFETISVVRKSNVDIFVFHPQSDSRNDIKNWIKGDYYYECQVGESLGDKMLNAFGNIFDRGYSKAVIVGSDIPDLSVKIIKDAFKALDKTDVIIGPSNDGGYYLLGMNHLIEKLFNNIQWSTDRVFNHTIETCKAMGLPHQTLKKLRDIDVEHDLKEWLSENNTNTNLKNNVRNIL